MLERILLIAIFQSLPICAMDGVDDQPTTYQNFEIEYDKSNETELAGLKNEEHDLLRTSQTHSDWDVGQDQRKSARIKHYTKYAFGFLCAMSLYPHVPCDSSDPSLLFMTVAGNLAVFALVSNVKQLIDAKTVFSNQQSSVYDFCERYAGGFFITLLMYSNLFFPHSNDCFFPNYFTIASNLFVCAVACYAVDVLLEH